MKDNRIDVYGHSQRVQVRLGALLERVHQASSLSGVSASEWIRVAIESALDRDALGATETGDLGPVNHGDLIG